MKTKIYSISMILFSALGLSSCSQEEVPMPVDDGKQMNFNFIMPGQTRVTETAFEDGDKVGLFVKVSAETLEITGNKANNEPLTYSAGKWSASRKLYWDDAKYDAFAYYPHVSDVTSIKDFPISVNLDQRTTANFAASDFLYASAKGLTASTSPIDLKFRHIMSRLTIRLTKGEDFEGDLPETATVFIHNTVTDATVDLSAGVATPEPKGAKHTVAARKSATNSYTAIIVPQRLQNRVPLIEVVMNGVSYLYESKFVFKPGIHSTVDLVIDKNPEQLKIEIGGEIINWN